MDGGRAAVAVAGGPVGEGGVVPAPERPGVLWASCLVEPLAVPASTAKRQIADRCFTSIFRPALAF